MRRRAPPYCAMTQAGNLAHQNVEQITALKADT
jgi:hypothetical protein